MQNFTFNRYGGENIEVTNHLFVIIHKALMSFASNARIQTENNGNDDGLVK